MPLVYSAQIAAQLTRSSGPLPPPEVLRDYESIKPGLVDRIVKMAEDEANHRRKMEAEVVAVQSRDQRAYRRSELLGQIFGWLIGMLAVSGAVYCGAHGAQFAASIIGSAGVGGIVAALIAGRNLYMKQREQESQLESIAAEHRASELKNITQSPENSGSR